MANGTESTEGEEGSISKYVVLSKVRTGLKREFAFAMKAQSEICGGSLSRTRSRKTYPDVLNIDKKTKRKNTVIAAVVDDEKLIDSVDNVKKIDKRECVIGLPVSNEVKLHNAVDSSLFDEEGTRRTENVDDCKEEEEEEGFKKPDDDGVATTSDNSKNNVESEGRPARRFTRSALKAQVEPTKQNVETAAANAVVVNGLSNEVIAQKSVGRPSSSNSSTNTSGKLTKKFLKLHQVVFAKGALPDGAELSYFVRGEKTLIGYKQGSGILCTHCNNVISPSQFESHAGSAQRRKPFHNIYTSNGVSLHEFSCSLSKNPNYYTHKNDELCSICHDRGNLLCCGLCPRAYHMACIPLTSAPSGTWLCKTCVNQTLKESFVSCNANAIAAGRVEGVDSIEQITKRLIRIVETPDVQVGGCTLCRGHEFSKSGFGPQTVMICDKCEREFHVGCLKEHNMADLKELPPGKWFCCTACDTIHSALEKLINAGEQKLSGSSLDGFLKKQNSEGEEKDIDLSWRVLNWKMKPDDISQDLLSNVVEIFHDRFDPIGNSATTKDNDLTHSMVFGKKTKDHDFGGMYCAILTVNQEAVSSGIFRIFGRDFAELPLVATITKCQGKGYFQVLYDCIEKLLGRVNVKTLVLPAANEVKCIWTNKFGFEMMDAEEVSKLKRDYPVMTFSGTSVLQKVVPECEADKE